MTDLPTTSDDTPPVAAEEPPVVEEPSDEQLRSDEARKLRLQRNDYRDQLGNVITDLAAAVEHRDTAQRALVEVALAGKSPTPRTSGRPTSCPTSARKTDRWTWTRSTRAATRYSASTRTGGHNSRPGRRQPAW